MTRAATPLRPPLAHWVGGNLITPERPHTEQSPVARANAVAPGIKPVESSHRRTLYDAIVAFRAAPQPGPLKQRYSVHQKPLEGRADPPLAKLPPAKDREPPDKPNMAKQIDYILYIHFHYFEAQNPQMQTKTST